jgi:hypothetical protein
MTLQVQHPVADWYLQFDDLWELMRVNWQTHNTFTQSGMWAAGEYNVLGIPMVIDNPPYRGVMLQVTTEDEADYCVVVTYGPKCNECGYQPYNMLGRGGDDEGEAITWGAEVITQLIGNAIENGVERLHEDGCSHIIYDQEHTEATLKAVDD